jgi:hypothetical protein
MEVEIKIDSIAITTMSQLVVISYLGQCDDWLEEHTVPKIDTQHIRNALFVQYYAVH